MIKILKKATKEDLKEFMYGGFQEIVNDPKMYEVLNSGKALNVFQMSAGTASRVVDQVKPNNLIDLTCCNSMARPGTIDNLPSYVEGKDGKRKYKHPIITNILDETYGIILFQEQVMRIAVDIADHKDGGNVVRGLLKRLGKANKKQEDLDAWNAMTKELEVKAKEKGIPSDEIKMLLDDILALANYSFNKSHALAYSLMAAWTMYLNVYFSKYYYPAVIEYSFDSGKDILDNLKEMRSNGYNIISPNLINSKARTYSADNNIYIGLHDLKSVGESAEDVCANSPYIDFRDFLKKNLNNSKINKRVITALVEYGCFDELEKELSRHKMIASFNAYWENKPTFKKVTVEDSNKIKEDPAAYEVLINSINSKIDASLKFWDEVKNRALSNPFGIEDDQDFYKECEEKYLGFNFFVTPFSKDVNDIINEKVSKGLCLDGFESLRRYKNISKVVPVFISSVREYTDKNGNDMCFLTLEDRNSEKAVLPIFASIYPYIEDKIAQGVIALILLYNTDDNYNGRETEKIMFGVNKKIDPKKYSSFIIPIKQGKI